MRDERHFPCCTFLYLLCTVTRLWVLHGLLHSVAAVASLSPASHTLTGPLLDECACQIK